RDHPRLFDKQRSTETVVRLQSDEYHHSAETILDQPISAPALPLLPLQIEMLRGHFSRRTIETRLSIQLRPRGEIAAYPPFGPRDRSFTSDHGMAATRPVCNSCDRRSM